MAAAPVHEGAGRRRFSAWCELPGGNSSCCVHAHPSTQWRSLSNHSSANTATRHPSYRELTAVLLPPQMLSPQVLLLLTCVPILLSGVLGASSLDRSSLVKEGRVRRLLSLFGFWERWAWAPRQKRWAPPAPSKVIALQPFRRPLGARASFQHALKCHSSSAFTSLLLLLPIFPSFQASAQLGDASYCLPSVRKRSAQVPCLTQWSKSWGILPMLGARSGLSRPTKRGPRSHAGGASGQRLLGRYRDDTL